MAEGAGTHEGYEPRKVLAKIRRPLVWVRVPTFNEDGTEREGPPYAWRTEEREA